LLIWPFPLLGLEGTTVPVLRYIQLATSLSVLIALEGAGGMVGALFALLSIHALVYGLVLFGAASILSRKVLSRLPARVGGWITLAAVIGLLAWASFVGPYDSTFHHSNAHASLLDLYR
jgi:hypothetical protein